MVRGLRAPQAYPGAVTEVELAETHISWVFLAGDYAYKFKKPLDLGFLDFREPARRLHFCREELRLNGRLAPEIYLDLAGATRTPAGWRVGPWREGAEPAVRMRRFPAAARLDRRLEAGRLPAAALERFARALAGFQQGLPPAGTDQALGSAAQVVRPALANFDMLRDAPLDSGTTARLDALATWTRNAADELAPVFDARLATGRVREGHGDLHLGNLVMLADRIVAFDGIEFDPALRWIDLQSEVAFLLMDLESRGYAALGWRWYNAWLQASGDYEGLRVLRWYLVYRHLVRAKIAAIRHSQGTLEADEAAALARELARHVELAAAHAAPAPPRLLLMSGYSGSGKSRLAQRLAPELPAVMVRSDVERKRLHGIDPARPAAAAVGHGLYDAAASERTYARLAEIARLGLGAGWSMVVDAAFLESSRREAFLQLGLDAGARPAVLRCEAPAALLRARVANRSGDPSDAGLDVLEAQLARPPESGPLERQYAVAVDTSDDPELSGLLRRLP
ncbi:bifunctional aminoglycoside phosphotransferase/ATP-binding protein [Thioalkalivibrio sp. XN8]|uniref:bifunctional aminoglycoside phosphotransferase/ATP-binding protein n=1 Tax=Thioalkalivibrio sp. XN8 TaxID=2712863 RepID=UPI0013E9EFB5|nr:bifunctional aminoglycoside phosphotransferase/ATP-binding protein [Thioalkalivibrio sp. XN8]NGP54186.1 AAA family ATPase [Thioalkalivibrio sp. XN8]